MPTASVESINAKQPEEVKIDRNKRIPSEIMPRQSEEARAFLLTFILFYLIYLVFETWFFFSFELNQKRKKKNKKKNETVA